MINNKKILAVITARRDSQGIKGKNYRNLCGKPLFWWSVEAAIQSEYIDKIAISSNCPNCKEVYDNFKFFKMFDSERVVWIQRPEEYATAISKNEEALIHAYGIMKKDYEFFPEIILNLQPTSPCRTEKLIDNCIKEYSNGDYDSLLTGKKETPFIWQKIDNEWKYTVDKNNCCDRKMRQQFSESEVIFHDDGNIFGTNIEILLETKCRIGKKPIFIEIDKINSLQIDTEFDFILIENILKSYKLESPIDDNKI